MLIPLRFRFDLTIVKIAIGIAIENLPANETTILEKLFIYSPLLKKTYTLCTELTAIFDTPLERPMARRKLNRWKMKVRGIQKTYFTSFLTTLENNLEFILNYFNNRGNSGFVEGFNNKLRNCPRISSRSLQRIFLSLRGTESRV